MTTPLSRAVSRRTLAAGAAWSVPVAAVAVAAPAFAASGAVDCVRPAWTDAWCFLYDYFESEYAVWQFDLTLGDDPCASGYTIDTVAVWTTYSAPAVNAGKSQLVATVQPGCAKAADQPTCPVAFADWDVPPVDDRGTSITQDYYAADPCGRLACDQTYLVVTYSSPSGDSGQARLTAPASCGITDPDAAPPSVRSTSWDCSST